MSSKKIKKIEQKVEEKEVETTSKNRTKAEASLLGLIPGTFISMSFRVLINVEALNAVESIGNIIRHRRASIIVPTGQGGLRVYTVPALSGECLKHSYQSWLAILASKKGLKVCEWCRKGEFIKHGVEDLIIEQDLKNAIEQLKSKAKSKEAGKYAKVVESIVIKNCIVEDVGGFMIPTAVPVKRTSRIQFSYALPAMDDLKDGYVKLEPQFHTRHAPTAVTGRTGEEAAQAIFYVESGSAVYTFTVNLDISGIGFTTIESIDKVIDDDERFERIKLAILALTEMLKSGIWGGKLSYYLPFEEVLSCIAIISKPIPNTVVPGHSRTYIRESIRKCIQNTELLRRHGFSEDFYVIYYVSGHEISDVRSGIDVPDQYKDKIKRVESIGEFSDELITKTLEFERSE